MPDFFDQLTAKNDADKPIEQVESTQVELEPSESIYTPKVIKQTAQELMKFGLIEAEKMPRLYQTCLTQMAQIQQVLEPFDLSVKVDDVRGLAFLLVSGALLEEKDQDDWSHPLVRRQRLNLEQSLLIAILRKYFLKHELESGVGASQAQLHLEDVLPDVQMYLGDMGSEQREQTRLRNLLEKLKGHGIVSEVDQNDMFHIRPIIAHLANPENLANLLETYRQQASKDD